MNQIKALERAALDAFQRGETWAAFWEVHGNEVKAAEPWNRRRFKRLVNRLLSLVASGDTAGMMPVADDDALPWALDDEAIQPADVGTQAKFVWTQLSDNEVMT